MRTLADVRLEQKAVFLRCELNVPLDSNGVADLTRVEASRPTFEVLLANSCKIIVCSHLGRPWGMRDPSKSLGQLVSPLESVLGQSVRFVADCIGPVRDEAVVAAGYGDVLLLENVRYYREENDNDAAFGAALVSGIDVYVNDAFGNSHRAHASMVSAALAAPVRCAGLLLERELRELERINDPSFRPTLAIIGGAKVSGSDGKLAVIRGLLSRVDRVAIVGKIAYYFLLAAGVGVGDTLTADTRAIDAPDASLDEDLEACRHLLDEAARLERPILLPADSVVQGMGSDEVIRFDSQAVPAGGRALDIGPATLDLLRGAVEDARLILWNGPAGYFEQPDYRAGTIALAHMVAHAQARSIVGGGDTVAALAGELAESSTVHISTGGGAMLTWLTGAELPAIRALSAAPAV